MSLNIVVVGTGSFGLALGKLTTEAGHRTVMIARREAVVTGLNNNNRHPDRFPDVRFPPGLTATLDPSILSQADVVVSAIPTISLRDFWSTNAQDVPEGAYWICASKGIENETLKSVNEIMEELLSEAQCQKLSFLSGPSFAKEMIARQPTAVTVASHNESVAKHIQALISTDYFRVYTSTDVLGVELGGALKNVIAIATGMAEGLGYGLNTQAALITRGLREIMMLSTALGAQKETLYGLSGLGDLVLTAGGGLSRNRRVGMYLGRGETLNEIIARMDEVAEGVYTTKTIKSLIDREDLECPIMSTIYDVLYEGLSPREGVSQLMARDLRSEQE